MDLQTTNQMTTPDDKRIECAKILGWKSGHTIQWTEKDTRHYDWGMTDPKGNVNHYPPDYPNDPRCRQEMLAVLSKKERWKLRNRLEKRYHEEIHGEEINCFEDWLIGLSQQIFTEEWLEVVRGRGK